jgi:uncharacterized protein
MSEDMPDSLIPYDEIVQEALRAVVGRVLGEVASTGLPGGHHFYISFKTQAPGVAIPRSLIERFWDLKVSNNGFEVGLTFNQVPSHLSVPFSAIVSFVDPAVNFALQFQTQVDDLPDSSHEPAENDRPSIVSVEDGSNVVSVDFGRKK